MKTVYYTEIFCGKTIEVYTNGNIGGFRVDIDGNVFIARGGGVNTRGIYNDIKKATGAAKSSIKKNMTKADKIKMLEEQIAKLKAEVEN